MFWCVLVLLFFLKLCISNAAVFLWSNQQLGISPLQPFATKEFLEIIEELDNPEVHIFKSPSSLSSDIKELTTGYYTAYSPNGYLPNENVTDLLGDGELDVVKIREVLNDCKSNNTLSVIIVPDNSYRYKREVEDETNAITDLLTEKNLNGSVIYKGQNTNNKLYALLYSSKPLLLRRNETEFPELYLGKTDDDMIIYDTRLNLNIIPLGGGGKITLRFSFTWVNGYWYMPAVKITDTNTNKDYNLTTDENIMAPAHFSYHCNGYTLFSDMNGAELYIYDLQVQTDSTDGKFGDANDCVSFTTAPIWSGLFVTTLLGIGLIIALTAIMDIKTMDKFDNCKTKNLAITIFE